MKSNWIVIVLFAIVLIFAGIVTIKEKNTREELQMAKLQLAVQNDTITSIRTKSGDIVAKLQSVETDRNNLQQALEEMGLDNKKKLREQEIKWRDIVFVLQAKLAASGHGQTIIRDTVYQAKTDTIRAGKFVWSNKFLFLNGSIKDKQLAFDYLYKTDVSIIQTQSRKGTQVSLMLSDPNARITNGASFTVIHKKSLAEKWWIVGPIGILTGILISK